MIESVTNTTECGTLECHNNLTKWNAAKGRRHWTHFDHSQDTTITPFLFTPSYPNCTQRGFTCAASLPLNKKSASCEFSSLPVIEFAEQCWHHHQFPQLPLNPLRSSSRKAFFGKTLASGFCSWNNQSVPIPIQHMSKWYSIVVNQIVNSFCLYPHRTSI
jgi:hypothetical protein